MADNNKVTIDAAWFAELWKIANEADKVCEDCVREKCGECKIVKERDELKAKLATSHNYEAVIAAKDRAIEAVKEERNRLNAKVNELMKRQCASATGELGNACSVAKRCQELDEENKTLKAKLESYPLPKPRLQAKVAEMEKKLAAAERCIEDIERNLITLGDFERRVFDVLIRAWREKREAK